MRCDKCGYMMSDFDSECPRCKGRSSTAPTKAATRPLSAGPIIDIPDTAAPPPAIAAQTYACPQCHSLNLPAYQHCLGCGAQLPWAKPAPVAAPVAATDPPLRCLNCNNINPPGSTHCVGCKIKFDTFYPAGVMPPKKADNTGLWILGGIFMLCCGFPLSCVMFTPEQPKSAYVPSYSAPSQPIAPVKLTTTVYYRVTGSTDRADVTYETAGGTQQINPIAVPWTSGSFEAGYSQFLYISAQNQESSGSVTVEIYEDGVLAKTATSAGQYTIASTSDSVR